MAAEFVERRIQTGGQLTNFNIDRSSDYIDVVRQGQKTRIYGTSEQLAQYQQKKPDGKPVNRQRAQTSVSQGKAEVTTGTKEEGAINPVVENKITINPRNLKTTRSGIYLPNIVTNPLENFASYAPLWTLAVLTPKQFNNPSSYRTDDLSFAGQTQKLKGVPGKANNPFGYTEDVEVKSSIVFSSGGRGDKLRTNTFYGTPEYYLDDFNMKAVVSASNATGNTNAIGFDFKIYEPYSMGLLLQSLQTAALNAGYVNYLESPFLLRLDFKGHNEDGTQRTSVKPKFFVMKLKSVKFETDEAGSTYTVEAIPYNHQAYSDTVNTVWQNFSIRPKLNGKGTVEEALITSDRSLVNVLNENEKKNVDAGKYKIPDVYEIQFPEKSHDYIPDAPPQKDKGATQDPNASENKTVGGVKSITKTDFGQNPIGQSDFGFTQAKGGNIPFSLEGDTFDEDTGRIVRNKMSIDPKNRNFHFSKGQGITDVINQVILSSKYAKDAVTNEDALTPEGYIKWFRLDIQMELLDYDVSIGDFARKYVFRVVPFFVHQSIFSNPQTVPFGYNELQKKIVKKYEYIYTGNNVDVIGFDIEINNMFYTGTNTSVENTTLSAQNKNQGGTSIDDTTDTKVGEGAATEAQAGNLPKSKIKRDPGTMSIARGGMGYADVEQKVAEAFQNAFVNSNTTDLVSLDLEIIGDTYWLVDSGIANHFSPADARSEMINEDGTANFEGQEVYVYLSFRTPSDVDTNTGMYNFKQLGKESPFSGIYKVTRCESNFSDGKFTQKLRCLRMQGQALDYDGQSLPTSKQGTLATKAGGKTPEKAGAAEAPPKTNKNDVNSFFDLVKQYQQIAEENGWEPSTGPNSPPKAPEPKLIVKRRQKNGTLVNFNIDKSKPFVDSKDEQGNTIRIYET